MVLHELLNAIMEIVEEKCNEGDYIEISNKIKEVYKIKDDNQQKERIEELEIQLDQLYRENLNLSDYEPVRMGLLVEDVLTSDTLESGISFHNYFDIYYDSHLGFICESVLDKDISYEEWRIPIIHEFATFFIGSYFPFTIQQLFEAKDYCKKNDIQFIMKMETEEELSIQVIRILFAKALIENKTQYTKEVNRIIKNTYNDKVRMDIEYTCLKHFITDLAYDDNNEYCCDGGICSDCENSDYSDIESDIESENLE